MRKRITVLMMAFVMVFTMVVPSFAGSCAIGHNFVSPKYLALGDSIGTGVKGGQMLDEDAFAASASFDQNKSKNWDVHAVDHSYVNKFANAIKANNTSWNATFVSLRAKDYCYMLGLAKDSKMDSILSTPLDFSIDELKTLDLNQLDINELKNKMNFQQIEDNWNTIRDDFFGWLMYNIFWKDLSEDVNVKELKKAIKTADVISVELGANEISTEAIGDVLCKIMPQIVAAVNATKNIKEARSYVDLYNDIVNYFKNPFENSEAKLKAIGKDLERLKALGASLKDVGTSYSELISEISKSAIRAKKDYRLYTDRLMKYIRKQNPGAILIATNVPNPMKGFSLKKIMSEMGVGDIDVPEIDMSLLMKPVINDMNAFLIKDSIKRSYAVADIRKVLLNPDGPGYIFHPDESGHDIIAKSLEKAYRKSVKNLIKKKVEKVGKVIATLNKVVTQGKTTLKR